MFSIKHGVCQTLAPVGRGLCRPPEHAAARLEVSQTLSQSSEILNEPVSSPHQLLLGKSNLLSELVSGTFWPISARFWYTCLLEPS